MRNNELRAMTDAQMAEQILSLKQELFNLRFQVAAYKNPVPSRFKQAKKEIARINTILRERELERLAAKQG